MTTVPPMCALHGKGAGDECSLRIIHFPALGEIPSILWVAVHLKAAGNQSSSDVVVALSPCNSCVHVCS